MNHGTVLRKTASLFACIGGDFVDRDYSDGGIFNDSPHQTFKIAERNGVHSGGHFNRSVLLESRAAERNRRLGVRIGHRACVYRVFGGRIFQIFFV